MEKEIYQALIQFDFYQKSALGSLLQCKGSVPRQAEHPLPAPRLRLHGDGVPRRLSHYRHLGVLQALHAIGPAGADPVELGRLAPVPGDLHVPERSGLAA